MDVDVLDRIGMQYKAVAYFCIQGIIWVVYPCLLIRVLSKKGGGKVDDASSSTLVGAATVVKA
eukprot:9958042-Ditylum_brightwellii.AAC.1